MSSAEQPGRAGVDGAAEIEFPGGLVGLPDARSFRCAPLGDAYFELVGPDGSGLEFVAVAADAVLPGMAAELRGRDLIGPDDILLALLATHGEPRVVTANLAGPIAIDLATAAGRQLVLDGSQYPLRAPLPGAG